jgi:hypothetical protein
MGNDYTYISLEKRADANRVAVYEWKRAGQRFLPPHELTGMDTGVNTVWLGVRVYEDGTYAYTYSLDGKQFREIGSRYNAEPGTWIGAKAGLFCLNPAIVPTKGYADFDFFRVDK